MEWQNNSFDDVRLIAATTVVIGHAWPLAARIPEPSWHGYTASQLAVYVFFALSGYMIAQSLDRDANLSRFAVRRALRILPGLAVVTIVAILAGAVLTNLPAAGYWSHPETAAYALNAALFTVYELPGVLTEPMHLNKMINGSIWTIPYEVVFYVLLALTFGRAKAFATLFGGTALILAICLTLDAPPPRITTDAHLIPEYIATWLPHFLIGAALYKWRDRIVFHAPGAIVVAAAAFAITPERWTTIAMLALPYAAIAVGRSAWQPCRAITVRGDFSYSVYLYGFLVQQCVTHFAGDLHPITSAAIGTAVTFVAAVLSWRFVEAPALALKSSIGRRSEIPPILQIP